MNQNSQSHIKPSEKSNNPILPYSIHANFKNKMAIKEY